MSATELTNIYKQQCEECLSLEKEWIDEIFAYYCHIVGVACSIDVEHNSRIAPIYAPDEFYLNTKQAW